MDSTWLIAALLLGIPILLGFLFHLVHTRAKNKQIALRRSKIQHILTENNIVVAEKEEASNYFIAIDQANHQLVYMRHTDEDGQVHLVDLRQVKKTKLEVEENIIYDQNKAKTAIVERRLIEIRLELESRLPNQSPYKLVFYQIIHDPIEERENLKRRTQHWQERVNSLIL